MAQSLQLIQQRADLTYNDKLAVLNYLKRPAIKRENRV